MVFITALRVDLSLAIVCMVKASNETDSFNSTNTTELGLPGFEVEEVGVLRENSSVIEDGGDCVADVEEERMVDGDLGEFYWNKQYQSEILAAFFYGYIILQIPGGFFARVYGSRLVIGLGVLLCSVATILLPICARTHVYLVFASRFVAGLGTSVCLPAMLNLWGRWAPPLERTMLTSVCMAGIPVGVIISMALSGYLCTNGFDHGWGSIFYVFGAGSILWLALWYYVVYDSPGDHPRISPEERAYIQEAMEDSSSHKDKDHKTPWLAIFTSRSVWVVICGHFCTNWLNLTLATDLPTYMKEVLKFDVKSNGLLSSVPYMSNTVVSLVIGFLADIIRRKQWLSTTATRRWFQGIAFVGAGAFLIAAGFVECKNRWQAVLFIAFANGFLGFTRAGAMINHVDFGRRYAGELYGITNTVANAPGMVVPIVNGALSPNGTRQEWLYVFIVCGSFCVFGTLIFSTMARGTPEPWADTQMELEVKDTEQEMSEIENGDIDSNQANTHNDEPETRPKEPEKDDIPSANSRSNSRQKYSPTTTGVFRKISL